MSSNILCCCEATRSCCVGGVCLPGLTQAACENQGGLWLAPNVPCSPNPCGPPLCTTCPGCATAFVIMVDPWIFTDNNGCIYQVPAVNMPVLMPGSVAVCIRNDTGGQHTATAPLIGGPSNCAFVPTIAFTYSGDIGCGNNPELGPFSWNLNIHYKKSNGLTMADCRYKKTFGVCHDGTYNRIQGSFVTPPTVTVV